MSSHLYLAAVVAVAAGRGPADGAGAVPALAARVAASPPLLAHALNNGKCTRDPGVVIAAIYM